MNTKIVMTLSAIVMGTVGILLSFLPQEVLAVFLSSTPVHTISALVVQLMGAMYFGFAMINWTAKANLIGGIYGRPIAIGNFTHFTIGSLALLKTFISTHAVVLLAPALFYSLFAFIFGVLFFTHPIKEKKMN